METKTEKFVYLWFFTQLPVFAIGILVFFIWKNVYSGVEMTSQSRGLGTALLILAGFLTVAFIQGSTYLNLVSNTVLYGIVAGILLISQIIYPNKLIVNRFFILLGRLSFSIYLVHFTLLTYLKEYFTFPANGILANLPSFTVLLAISTFISCFTYKWIESPGIRLGKNIINSLEKSTKDDHSQT